MGGGAERRRPTMVVSSQRPSTARPSCAVVYRQRVDRSIETTPSGSLLGVHFAGWGGGSSRFGEGTGPRRDPEIGPDALRLRPTPPDRRTHRRFSPTHAATKARRLNKQSCEDDGLDDVRTRMHRLPFVRRANMCAFAETTLCR